MLWTPPLPAWHVAPPTHQGVLSGAGQVCRAAEPSAARPSAVGHQQFDVNIAN
jgi:hypothetical protein